MKFQKSLWVAGLLLAILLSSCAPAATPAPTQDVGAIQTQAASVAMTEVSMQFTQTAMAIPPTPVPTNTFMPTPTLGLLPTLSGANTPLALSTVAPGTTAIASPFATLGSGVSLAGTKNGCNDGLFEFDTGAATVDWTVLKGGTEYSHAWSINNTGTCTWGKGYSFFLVKEASDDEIKWHKIKVEITDKTEVTPPGRSQLFVVNFTTPTSSGRYQGFWKMMDDKGNIFGPMVWIRFEIKK